MPPIAFGNLTRKPTAKPVALFLDKCCAAATPFPRCAVLVPVECGPDGVQNILAQPRQDLPTAWQVLSYEMLATLRPLEPPPKQQELEV